MRVHSALGPGLLESAYQACLLFELRDQGLKVLSEVELPIVYRDVRLDVGYRIDLLVEDQVIVELKSLRRSATPVFCLRFRIGTRQRARRCQLPAMWRPGRRLSRSSGTTQCSKQGIGRRHSNNQNGGRPSESWINSPGCLRNCPARMLVQMRPGSFVKSDWPTARRVHVPIHGQCRQPRSRGEPFRGASSHRQRACGLGKSPSSRASSIRTRIRNFESRSTAGSACLPRREMGLHRIAGAPDSRVNRMVAEP